jgi:predicted ATPase
VPGRLVAKRELLERAWPGGRVDDANLKVQISTLRKALRGCEGLIRAESSLGYRFLGEAVRSDPYLDAQRRSSLVPRLLTEPIGRDGVIADIVGLLKESRLVTVLGPGGIGKTTVALAIAHRLAHTFADETCFIDLSRIACDDQICEAVACALGSPVGEAPPAFEQIQAALQGRRFLLVIDSCEHVADATALLVEQILGLSNEVWILVTSRESLRVGAEFVWQLEPLEVPPSLMDNAANIARYPAVQLFLRTAAEVSDDFTLDDEIAPTIVEVCRRLDGIPRAIEMTASMAATRDIGELRRRLDQGLPLLAFDRHGGNALHDSLFSTLRWRCDLLPFNEQAVLRRLALFTGSFTLDAAVAVAADDVMDASVVRAAVIALANKSFLIVNLQISPPEYRLFETMRAYVASSRGEGEHATGRLDGIRIVNS